MSHLWDKGFRVAPEVIDFTAGDDYLLDRALVPYDLVGSAAHAHGLRRAGILSDAELRSLLAALRALQDEFESQRWTVEKSDEDGHSAIERMLVTRLDKLGGKIHTARSRNDQVVLAVRLWLRDALTSSAAEALAAVQALLDVAERHVDLVMPGYTHLQRAMPTTAAAFLAGYAAELLEGVHALTEALRLTQLFPLGSGAGYGVPIQYDRAFVASLLAFERVQEPVTAVQLSRGKAEAAALFAWTLIAADIGKLAFDLELYATREFAFVRLPKELTTGSSLMPQKQNPDVLELMRAHGVVVKTALTQILDLVAKLPGGYHRDFQLTKAPLLQGRAVIAKLVAITTLVVKGIAFDPEAIARAMTPELWATHAAHERLQDGLSFREAYREVGVEHLQGRTSGGKPVELPPVPLATLRAAAQEAARDWQIRAQSFAGVAARVWEE